MLASISMSSTLCDENTAATAAASNLHGLSFSHHLGTLENNQTHSAPFLSPLNVVSLVSNEEGGNLYSICSPVVDVIKLFLEEIWKI